MTAPRPRSRELARSLLGQEMADGAATRAPRDAALRACGTFYERLSPLVTLTGSQAFLSRSLALARSEYPFLSAVRAGPSVDNCLEGLDAALDGVETAAAVAAFETVFGHMIGLLVTFIGEDLTLHAIRDGWPGAQLPREAEQT